jgi:type 1 glutamine amidotransferase
MQAQTDDRVVLLIAGKPSHGPGQHEHKAGVLLFQKCLASVPGLTTRVALNGWPQDEAALEGVHAIVIYSDGGRNHPALVDGHLAVLNRLMSKGTGLGLIHYAIEPAGTGEGRSELLQWVGGYFEIHWSVNPSWEPVVHLADGHPIMRGVQPFRVHDEWYYHLRFPEGARGVTPLLTAVAGPETLTRPDGPHQGNPAVRASVARGESQVLSWAFERPDGGRGFGFSGGHFHSNWANDDFRRFVLNSIVWLAKVEVPADGVASTVTPAELALNLDVKVKKPAVIPAAPSAEKSPSP